MDARATLDEAYALIATKADDGTCTQQERTMLLHAAADVRFRMLALENIEAERQHRAQIRTYCATPIHAAV